MLLILYADFHLLIAVHKLAVVAASQNHAVRAFVDSFYYTIDSMVGYIMFMLIGLLSFIGVVGWVQMKLLFNDAFAQSAQHGKIAKAMKVRYVDWD